MAKQEALELEQKRHLEVIFQIAREELSTVKHNDKKLKHDNEIVLAVKDLLNTTKTLPQAIVEQIRGQITYATVHTMKESQSDLAKLMDRVTHQLQKILKEIKIDPDNPKPIELRTEQK